MRKESSNQFTEGLVSDLNPINTPNTVLTDALNATIITYNGNEFSLQNDMGNYPLENCKLKPNYIPVGLKEHGDILYIVSYNPLTNHVEVGSYPSPLQVNAVDSEDYELEFGSILDDHLGIVAKYSELVKEETYIVFNGEDYKLYPGDAYKIDVEEEKYAYETFEYYILDDNSILHNVTEEVKKNINKEEYEHVSWLIPGYIAAKVRLARLSTSGLNVRSFYAPLKGNDERDVYFDFNIKVNIDDDLINNRLNSVSEYKNDLTFKVTIDNKRGNLKTDLLENPNLSEWYLDKNILWMQYKGELTTNKDDVLTVSVTPILTEKKGNEVLYSIAYDGLIQPQEFDLSRVNDKPFGIDDDFYKFYQTNDKEQVIEINVSGPTVTTSQVDLHYNIYTLEEQNKPAKTGKFDNYFGIGYNRLTIPFDDVFKKENIYIIEFIFKGDIEFTSPRRLLITTELLNGSEKANAYDRDLTMDDLVKKYFDRIIVKTNIDFTKTRSYDVYTETSEEWISEFISNYEYNTFIDSSKNIDPIDITVCQKNKYKAAVNLELEKTLGGIWTNTDVSVIYNDEQLTTDSEIDHIKKKRITCNLYPTGSENFGKFEIKKLSDFSFPQADVTMWWEDDIINPDCEYIVEGTNGWDYYKKGVYAEHNFGWICTDMFAKVPVYTGFIQLCQISFRKTPLSLTHYYYYNENALLGFEHKYLIFPPKNHEGTCFALRIDNEDIRQFIINNVHIIYDYENKPMSQHTSYYGIKSDESVDNKLEYKIRFQMGDAFLQGVKIENVVSDKCLSFTDYICEKQDYFVINEWEDINDEIVNILNNITKERSSEQINRWKDINDTFKINTSKPSGAYTYDSKLNRICNMITDAMTRTIETGEFFGLEGNPDAYFTFGNYENAALLQVIEIDETLS